MIRPDIDYLLAYPKVGEHSGDQYIPLSIMKVGSCHESKGEIVEYWDGRCDSIKRLIYLARCTHKNGILFSCMEGTQYHNAVKLMKILHHNTQHDKFIVGGYKAINEKYHGYIILHFPYGVFDVIFDNSRYDMQDPITEKTKRFYSKFKPLLFTSYGCKNNCHFCSVSGKWTPVPLEQIEKEIEIISRFGHKFVTIGDPNFACNDGERKLKIVSLLDKYELEWHCNASIKQLSYNFLDTAKRLKSIEIGVESGSKRLLKVINKTKRPTEYLYRISRFNARLKKYNVSPMYSFMVGLPTEKRNDILDTMKLIDTLHKENKNARFSIYTYTSYPSLLQDKFPDYINVEMSHHPLYWLCGLKYRKDNVKKNFPKLKRFLSILFEVWSEIAWKLRIFKFPKRIFELIIEVIKK